MKYLVTICIVFSFFLVGCTHKEVYKLYEDTNVEVKGNAKFLFSMEATASNEKFGITVYGEPYQMVVFIPNIENLGAVALEGLSLSGEDGSFIELPDKSRNLLGLEKDSNSTVVIIFNIDRLVYQSYSLLGELVLERGEEVVRHHFEVPLNKDHREDRMINRVWEGVKS